MRLGAPGDMTCHERAVWMGFSKHCWKEILWADAVSFLYPTVHFAHSDTYTIQAECVCIYQIVRSWSAAAADTGLIPSEVPLAREDRPQRPSFSAILSSTIAGCAEGRPMPY